MKLGFCSDIHLDHLHKKDLDIFIQNINSQNLDGLIISGDISNGNYIVWHLTLLDEGLNCPIYFVLGNHDFWGKSFNNVRSDISKMRHTKLNYLTLGDIYPLTNNTCLIGHDGWYDAENGNFAKSKFWPKGFPEFRYVDDLKYLPPDLLKQTLVNITRQASENLQIKLDKALSQYSIIYLATHVPPYREASWHLGKISDDEGAPFFSNKIIGEALTNKMLSYPDNKLIVLAGHTHSESIYNPIPNIHVYTSNAEYGAPCIYKVFDI